MLNDPEFKHNIPLLKSEAKKKKRERKKYKQY